jgi:cob(I)alamin adenosyltransferase
VGGPSERVGRAEGQAAAGGAGGSLGKAASGGNGAPGGDGSGGDAAPGREAARRERRPAAAPGLVIVHTGEGKGKTTAALGLALRAVGNRMRVCVIQFIKGQWQPGEKKAAALLPGFEFIPLGEGFTWTKTPEAHMAALREAWAKTREVVRAGRHDVVILDEINYALAIPPEKLPVHEVFTVADVVDLLRSRPPAMHVVLTGRYARPEIVDLADLVTEMRLVKHPFRQGRRASRGIEF